VSGRDGGPLWEAFATGDQSFLDGDEHGTGVGPDTPSRRALVVPLGTHGIFVVGGTNGPLPQTTVDLASVLADNLETTFDRLEKERRLRTQERRLVEQNRELSRLNQLNEVIRNTNRALIRATSREAIERKVCEKLADAEPVVGAWIASFDEPGGGLDPVSVRGLDEEHLDELLAGGEGPVSGLAQTARRKAAVGIARGLFDDEAWRRRRRHVLTAGYTAVAAVPIVVRDAVERVLFLHVSDDELLRGGEAVLGELGQVVGSAIETVGNRRALLTDRNLQVDLTVADESFVFTRLSGRTGHDLDVRGIVPREDGSVVAFLTTHAPVEDVLSFAERTQVITDVAALSDESDDGETLFRVDINASVFDLLAKYDASLRSLTADGETTAMSVDLPEGVHVREFVEDLRTRYDGVELTARRQQTDSVETTETLPAMFESRCTDRQFEALETAYYGGFYEWPRQSNNADLAEVLGVSSPTYQAHRRAAERKLVAAVFT
jgi:predicted DNA binding protein